MLFVAGLMSEQTCYIVYLRDGAEGERGIGLLLLQKLLIETDVILRHTISY